ncbi:hypothetical protein SDC9_200108 [bioreactor metagenome]|uniref:Uncharacterized protein n=1 Tax=bioreactor metagenome TaxID=1076179 RepID=A0A645IN00_9ZZZZ
MQDTLAHIRIERLAQEGDVSDPGGEGMAFDLNQRCVDSIGRRAAHQADN